MPNWGQGKDETAFKFARVIGQRMPSHLQTALAPNLAWAEAWSRLSSSLTSSLALLAIIRGPVPGPNTTLIRLTCMARRDMHVYNYTLLLSIILTWHVFLLQRKIAYMGHFGSCY